VKLNVFVCAIDILELVQTQYSSNLSTHSYECSYTGTCGLSNLYCEGIEIHTKEEGLYIIKSYSNMDLLGLIYEKDFILFDLEVNATKWDDDSHYNNQFKITLYRQMNTSFILVVTTSQDHEQGEFSITIDGPSNVSMQIMRM